MAAINFPDNPTVGELFTRGNVTWEYNGIRWIVKRDEIQIINGQLNYLTVKSGESIQNGDFIGLDESNEIISSLYSYNPETSILDTLDFSFETSGINSTPQLIPLTSTRAIVYYSAYNNVPIQDQVSQLKVFGIEFTNDGVVQGEAALIDTGTTTFVNSRNGGRIRDNLGVIAFSKSTISNGSTPAGASIVPIFLNEDLSITVGNILTVVGSGRVQNIYVLEGRGASAYDPVWGPEVMLFYDNLDTSPTTAVRAYRVSGTTISLEGTQPGILYIDQVGQIDGVVLRRQNTSSYAETSYLMIFDDGKFCAVSIEGMPQSQNKWLKKTTPQVFDNTLNARYRLFRVDETKALVHILDENDNGSVKGIKWTFGSQPLINDTFSVTNSFVYNNNVIEDIDIVSISGNLLAVFIKEDISGTVSQFVEIWNVDNDGNASFVVRKEDFFLNNETLYTWFVKQGIDFMTIYKNESTEVFGIRLFESNPETITTNIRGVAIGSGNGGQTIPVILAEV